MTVLADTRAIVKKRHFFARDIEVKAQQRVWHTARSLA
jgi:hypothetical protein